MRSLWILSLPLVGCTAVPDSTTASDALEALAADGGSANTAGSATTELFDLPPADRAPAPGVLSLSSTSWWSTFTTTITVSDATPGDTVALLFTGSPNGPQTCPPVMAPDCLDIDSPRMFGTEVADASGVATFSLVLPDPPPPVAEVELQAVVLLAVGADTSNTEVHPLQGLASDLDLDGLSLEDEVLVHGTDPEIGDTDGGGVNDGDEVLAGTSPLDPADDGGFTYTWAGDIYPLFEIECAGCHVNGANSGGMNMDDPADVIGFPSNDVATMNRIEPGFPDDSYIWHKLNDTQAAVGGAGLQMPRVGPPLTQAELDMVETWILEGAPL